MDARLCPGSRDYVSVHGHRCVALEHEGSRDQHFSDGGDGEPAREPHAGLASGCSFPVGFPPHGAIEECTSTESRVECEPEPRRHMVTVGRWNNLPTESTGLERRVAGNVIWEGRS